MRRLLSCCALLFVAAVVSALCGRSYGVDPLTASGAPLTNADAPEAVLLLRNGGVLNGRVSQDAARYVVVGARSTFDVPAAQVAMVCRSLDDAYEQQRRQLAPNAAEGHLKLAEWCLRNEMLPQAAQELAEAERIEPHAPMSAVLKRRLDAATKPKSVPSSAKTKTHLDPEKAPEGFENLESQAAELPAGSVEKFTRKIQPLLVNNCTTSGCHQATSGESFQLDRAVLHGMSNRRTTLANLAAALTLINHAEPQSSPLVTIPRDVHAGMKQPIFGTRQKELDRQLSEWIALVTNTQLPTEEAESDVGEAMADASAIEPKINESAVKHRASVATTARNTSKTARTERKPNRFQELLAEKSAQNVTPKSGELSDIRQANYEAEDQPLMPPQPLRTGVQLQSWQPKDEFDAEIFNRQTQKNRVEAPASPTQ